MHRDGATRACRRSLRPHSTQHSQHSHLVGQGAVHDSVSYQYQSPLVDRMRERERERRTEVVAILAEREEVWTREAVAPLGALVHLVRHDVGLARGETDRLTDA